MKNLQNFTKEEILLECGINYGNYTNIQNTATFCGWRCFLSLLRVLYLWLRYYICLVFTDPVTNIYKIWWGQESMKEASNQQKLSSYSPGHGFENLWFVSIAQRVRVSHAFVYNAVDANKIITILLAKLPSCMNA